MPLFEFECPKCKGRVERLFTSAEQADSDLVLCDSMSCPTFGTDSESEMVRVSSVANFALKGAGFHVNDYPKGK